MGVAREREVFDDQVAAMQHRRREDKARYVAETRAEAERIQAEQGRLIDMWRVKKEREHAKTVQFAASLETSIARRQREESEKRESEKRADREHAVGMLKGMHPSRRLRKPAGPLHQHGGASGPMH